MHRQDAQYVDTRMVMQKHSSGCDECSGCRQCRHHLLGSPLCSQRPAGGVGGEGCVLPGTVQFLLLLMALLPGSVHGGSALPDCAGRCLQQHCLLVLWLCS